MGLRSGAGGTTAYVLDCLPQIVSFAINDRELGLLTRIPFSGPVKRGINRAARASYLDVH